MIIKLSAIAGKSGVDVVKKSVGQDLLDRFHSLIMTVFSNARDEAFDLKYYEHIKEINILALIEDTITALG